ncbi:L-histidine N(alpha)-methyltransferase [Mesonia aestuariivivens]|uniref:L-histidine N(Alpha)-methyltransferase n=1 Tax=Mesonia aestuariivivens TaxID=2796128 RepID=A0ABS6W4T3_9FLAO|nr:L-histidine N(alpha)-methyltransferase [Mesonia aestuariivivens]MBW2962143.1 L-histidine N(alpha)-methyltransferase [Mesonia aestuariivivens]
MKKDTQTKHNSEFASEVQEGLTAFPKYLSSKFIYDKKGDKLFQDIMNLPDYYLTNCEFDILEKHKAALSDYFNAESGFDLIELGAGDGKKTKILLKYLIDNKIDFKYLPIDISQNILDNLEDSLARELPKVNVETLQGSYFDVLKEVSQYKLRKKVIMVLGSNIGNLNHDSAIEFLKNIQIAMNPGDMLFMGFDQKKNPQTILDAYNDQTGVTEAFNKNLLERINRELEADFNLNKFKHWETYNPETGTAKSFLISTEEQTVAINALNLNISFKSWESIHTEISQKYDDEVVDWLADQAGLKLIEYFTDDQHFYKNYIFEKK